MFPVHTLLKRFEAKFFLKAVLCMTRSAEADLRFDQGVARNSFQDFAYLAKWSWASQASLRAQETHAFLNVKLHSSTFHGTFSSKFLMFICMDTDS